MKFYCDERKGITLIALVVTIIVILILAGISISMLTGENGILNRAQNAKEETESSQKQENTTLNDYEKAIDKYASNLPSTEYTEPYLPSITDFEKDNKTDLNSGLVIKEKTTGSEYVWIEVPKTTTVYPTAGLNITNFTDEEYKKIEEDLHTYTNEYRKRKDYNDIYSTDTTNGWFQSEKEYIEQKQKMLKSVYQNGGFWIGRYEAGIEKNRTASGDAEIIPLSKANLYPYIYVTRTQAKVLAEKVESGSYTSSLVFGVQWDLILKYIETKKINEDTEIKTNLGSNSTEIGNYKGTLWNITNSLAKYSLNSGGKFIGCPYKKELTEGVMLTTGADEKFSLMNVYDIAGNVWEWSLEGNLNEVDYCVYRGGCYSNDGSEFSARGSRM